MIRIRLIGRLAEGFQSREISVEGHGKSISEVIKELERTSGRRLYEIIVENGELREGFVILLNGQAVRGRLEEVRLSDGDELVILPPVSGGS